ncbi:MAG: hypothetical protein B2I17_02210 [Thermoplasmatales archaeon B_DKE]|nr:MAG: hypothetical protein B2I17_02210 [Thermoplasmatales archaeon B_DKE]
MQTSDSSQKNLWYSRNLSDFTALLNSFSTFEGFLDFINTLPKKSPRLSLYEGRDHSNLTVVIITANENSRYVTYLKSFFMGANVIISEANGQNFNYSHSVNNGLALAKKLDSEWVVVSNDDVFLPGDLDDFMSRLNSDKSHNVLTPVQAGINQSNIKYHGEIFSICRSNLFNSLLFFKYQKPKELWKMYRELPGWSTKRLDCLEFGSSSNNLVKKFSKCIFKDLRNFSDFGIFRSEILRDFSFDESFQNGFEDFDLVIRLHKSGISVDTLDFDVKSVGGASLGYGLSRWPLIVFGQMYLNYKIAKMTNSD